jgi:hypothetical protein
MIEIQARAGNICPRNTRKDAKERKNLQPEFPPAALALFRIFSRVSRTKPLV